MTQISAVIITKDEELNIDRCLDSLNGVVDEIIVIDSNSTDNTENICKKFNVRFIKRDFEGFSATKNYGDSLANFPYILSLDADEELSSELRRSILEEKQEMNQDGYLFNRLPNYCGHWIRHCGWYPDRKLRLWKKEKAQWQGYIHETLAFSGKDVKRLKGDILHYSYKTIEDHERKNFYFSEFAANDMFNRGKKAYLIMVIINPLFTFLKKYFFQLGFLDGYYGFVVCMMSSYYSFCKYAKLRDFWLRKKKREMAESLANIQ